MYHFITSPPLGSDLFFSFVPKFFKLLKGLLIILPELLPIPFVPFFLRNRVREITKKFRSSGNDIFPLDGNTTAPVVLTRIPIGLNSYFFANKINRYFFVHFLENVD